MLFRQDTLDRITRGEVDLAFRRWLRPAVSVGTNLRTSHGLIEITSVERLDDGEVSDGMARRAGYPDAERLFDDLRSPEPGRDLYIVGLRWAGPDPRVALRADADLTDQDVDELSGAVARIGSTGSPSGMELLEAIERHPETLADDVARGIGVEKDVFKRRVRQLKELGLTESLRRGYRLSPRAHELMSRLRRDEPDP